MSSCINPNLCIKPHLSSAQPNTNLPPSLFFNTHLLKTKPNASTSLFFLEKNTRTRRNSSVFRVRSVFVSPKANFYELLGIPESGSFSEIKQAYKQMALKYHPDVSPPDRMEENTKRFIEVQEAYETLSDPRRRAMYDRDLARGLHLAFSARKCFDEGLEERDRWRNHWQNQVAELKRRSMGKDSGENISWGAQMRNRRNAPSAE